MPGPDIVIEGTDQQGRIIRLEVDKPKTPYGGYVLCVIHPQSTTPIQPIVLDKFRITELIHELIETL